MPRMFRIMKKDDEDRPVVGYGFCELGVREIERDVDENGNVIPNDKGMSVSPEWRDISIFVIPRRLRAGGRGKPSGYCFRRGEGPFQQVACGNGLELVPTSDTHGVLRPLELAPLNEFLQNLANTRDEWVVDES